MATNLMNVFKNVDLQGVGKTAANIVSLAFKPNKKTGAKIARAVLDDGTTLIKTVTASGVVSETIHRLPEITSTVQRNEVIKDLCKQKKSRNHCSNARYFTIHRFKCFAQEIILLTK